MTVAEKVQQRILNLPEPLQIEVLKFVEFLLAKVESPPKNDLPNHEDREWMKMSLAMAMRGMEEEEGPDYTVADLKERFG